MKVIILTENLQAPPRDLEGAKRINWNDSSDRKWLMNHLHWAMHNQRSVALTPDSN